MFLFKNASYAQNIGNRTAAAPSHVQDDNASGDEAHF